jgi:hypothetical protein
MPATTDRLRATRSRPGPGHQHLRVSDADRSAVADQLGRHYADGRLDNDEFDERVTRAMAAKTSADFQGLLDDLPDLPAVPPARSAAASEPAVPPHRAPARRHRHHGRVFPGLVVLALLVVASSHHHWEIKPGWLLLLAVLIAVVTTRIARRR